jgi:hypothetical protein
MPVALETICARCLTKDKEQRYPTAQALAEDLTRFLNSEKIVGQESQADRIDFMWRARQNKPAAALVLSLLVSVIGFAGYGLRAKLRGAEASELAKADRAGQQRHRVAGAYGVCAAASQRRARAAAGPHADGAGRVASCDPMASWRRDWDTMRSDAVICRYMSTSAHAFT